VIDRRAPAPRETDPMALSLKTSLIVGLFQTLALIPGVSRSGGTIVGAMLLGVEKRAAAEFSFFLAMPTMAGAFVLDFWSSRGDLQGDRIGLLVLGFVVSFVVGYAVVRFMLDFIGRRGFAPFGWWRILVGVAGLALLGAS
jgi:undecaprenyl-diphosphatase